MSEQAIATQTEVPREMPVPLTAVISAEWQKLRTVRSIWIVIAAGLIFAIGFGTLVSWVSGYSFPEWSEADRADWDPISITLAGQFIAVPIAVYIATYLVTSEMASGMIRQTYLVTPRRARVVLAKAITASIVAGVFSSVVVVASMVAGQIVFEFFDVPRASLTASSTIWVIVALVATAPIVPWFCCCIAFVVRNTAVSIIAGLAFTFGPAMVGFFLPASWQQHFIALLPAPASDAIAIVDANRRDA